MGAQHEEDDGQDRRAARGGERGGNLAPEALRVVEGVAKIHEQVCKRAEDAQHDNVDDDAARVESEPLLQRPRGRSTLAFDVKLLRGWEWVGVLLALVLCPCEKWCAEESEQEREREKKKEKEPAHLEGSQKVLLLVSHGLVIIHGVVPGGKDELCPGKKDCGKDTGVTDRA